MNKQDIEKIGRQFYSATKTHQQIDPPSVAHPDISYEDAYAIQRVMIDEYLKDGFTLSGKKVGLTSQAMRKASNINEPDYGYIFNELCFTNNSVLRMEDYIAPRIECELFFKLKNDLLGANITAEEVLSATEYIVCGMELVDFRLFREKFQRVIQDSIADNAAFGGYIMGDIPVGPYDLDLSLVPFIFEVNNKQVEVSSGAAVFDNPASSVAWLANRFNELGNPLKKGELILSGSAVASVPVKSGDFLCCDFGPFGSVMCSFV